jgi:hypothetical protein
MRRRIIRTKNLLAKNVPPPEKNWSEELSGEECSGEDLSGEESSSEECSSEESSANPNFILMVVEMVLY